MEDKGWIDREKDKEKEYIKDITGRQNERGRS